jgi:hypothetical protein
MYELYIHMCHLVGHGGFHPDNLLVPIDRTYLHRNPSLFSFLAVITAVPYAHRSKCGTHPGIKPLTALPSCEEGHKEDRPSSCY